ncbi:MAG: hypothetical protein HY906_13580 [Deltaproteobacteria bacterium]|nr:hypothetical protein [Deltaproteobacteria bacterium]
MSRPRLAQLPLTRLLLTSLGGLALGCTEVGSRPWFDHPSPVPFTVVAVDPADGAIAVALDQPIDVYLSDLPDPDSATRDTFILGSGSTQFTGGFRVDLIDRRLRYLPARTLQPHLGMRVFVGRHLRALDGREIGEDLEWGFMTGATLGGEHRPAPPMSLDEVGPTLAARCATACHEGAAAFRGLDLSATDTAFAGLVGRASVERPEMSLVSAGDHARSYLVRKLLGAPAIVGDVMPPPPDEPLDAATLRRLADWIDDGAQR